MTNSKLTRQHILDHYEISPDKISVIYNGVDMMRFHPGIGINKKYSVRKALKILPDDITVLFVSNNFKLKQLFLILQAMAFLKDNSFKLVAVGSDNPDAYKRWAEKNGLGNQVFFPGMQNAIENYYAEADIFVLPTLYDAFANVCLEAMACGIPVITTETNGAAELISHGVHGYVLKRSDPRELAGYLVRLKSSSDRIRMGHEASKKASAFTLDNHLSELLNLYDRVRFQKTRQP